jgi:hypothetical protein
MIIGRYQKQPSEILDYDIDFTDWLEGRTDTIDTYTVSVPSDLTLSASNRTGNVIKVLIGGGQNGVKYKVTVSVVTDTTLVKEVEFLLTIKET